MYFNNFSKLCPHQQFKVTQHLKTHLFLARKSYFCRFNNIYQLLYKVILSMAILNKHSFNNQRLMFFNNSRKNLGFFFWSFLIFKTKRVYRLYWRSDRVCGGWSVLDMWTYLEDCDCGPEDIVKVFSVTDTLGVIIDDLFTITLTWAVSQHAKLTPKQVHP